MSRFVKIGACLLACLLFAYLMLIDYPRYEDSLTTLEDSSAASEQIDTADSSADSSTAENAETSLDEGTLGDTSVEETTETAALLAQAEALEQELEELREQRGSVPVALFFDQCNDVVYDELYPALSTAGYTGTIVFQDGALTGNYHLIETSEFKTMNEAGWEYAIGGDSTDIDLTGEVTVSAWQTSLETYMKALRARTGITPTLYVFREGEYKSEYDEVLEAEGYTALAYSAEDAAADTADSALTKLVWFRISAETDAEALLEEIQNYSCAVLMMEVDESVSTEEDSSSLEQYTALMEELLADGSVTVTTGTEVLETAVNEERQALMDQIQEKEAELAQVQAQLE